MKKITALIILLFSFDSQAAGGFTWIGLISKQTHIPEHILTFGIIGSLLSIVGLIYRAKIANVSNVVIPDKGITFRNLVEAYGKFIYTQCNAVLGEKDAPKYFQFVATIFILIFFSNLIGLIPGFLPPTEMLNTTLALGCFTFVYYNFKGCKEQGTINYLKHFAGPLWYLAFLIFPIEILSNFIRPMSLALRLQGNMMGDHKVLQTFSGLEVLGLKLSLFVPMPFYLLGLLVCFIQAYVFTMLSMVYISLATEHHDHDEAHAH
ncbi:MAG: F0F1 ATP synthase subunit A [Bacteriovoracaceae bacterium]|nr:F0F1 ATP synthase subunit A [Bacteriovoracaceae bacterium]